MNFLAEDYRQVVMVCGVLASFYGALIYLPCLVLEWGQRYFGWTPQDKTSLLGGFIFCGALGLFTIYFRQLGYEVTLAIVILLTLFLVSYFDSYLCVIPDRFQLLGVVAAGAFAVHRFGETVFIQNILCALLVYVFLKCLGYLYQFLFKKLPMGDGDIKLLAWVSLMLGPNIVWVLLVSCCSAAVWQALLAMQRSSKAKFPFAPHIAIPSAILLIVDLESLGGGLFR